MKYNGDWRHDLEVGQLGEKALGEILENKKLEVKTDLQARKTGNVFVEVESRGKKSGIVTTEADFWVFVISKDRIIIIGTNALKTLVIKNKHRVVKGGDSDTSRGVLIPVKELL